MSGYYYYYYYLCYFINDTDIVPCLGVKPTVNNANMFSYWGSFGTVASYTCLNGFGFVEGGTTRTIMCTNGQWGTPAKGCIGDDDLRDNTFDYFLKNRCTLFA